MKVQNIEEQKGRKFGAWKMLLAVICVILIGIGVFCGAQGTMAYLTARGGAKANHFTMGNVSVEIVEEFKAPVLKTGTNSYTKKVQLKNTGTVPAYVRAVVLFSDGDVEDVSMVSCDNGGHWYKLSDLKDHLPEGWVYEDGYYYYSSPVEPGKTTPALITNVKTEFIEKTADTNPTINQTVRDYDIFVYTEGIQQMKLDGSGLNSSYSDAWKEFLERK